VEDILFVVVAVNVIVAVAVLIAGLMLKIVTVLARQPTWITVVVIVAFSNLLLLCLAGAVMHVTNDLHSFSDTSTIMEIIMGK
jgi:hypothetical protein